MTVFRIRTFIPTQFELVKSIVTKNYNLLGWAIGKNLSLFLDWEIY